MTEKSRLLNKSNKPNKIHALFCSTKLSLVKTIKNFNLQLFYMFLVSPLQLKRITNVQIQTNVKLAGLVCPSDHSGYDVRGLTLVGSPRQIVPV